MRVLLVHALRTCWQVQSLLGQISAYAVRVMLLGNYIMHLTCQLMNAFLTLCAYMRLVKEQR